MAETNHTWVQLRYTPVDITPQADGTLKVEVTEGAEQIADEESLLGCWFCHSPLTTESYGTECLAAANSYQGTLNESM